MVASCSNDDSSGSVGPTTTAEETTTTSQPLPDDVQAVADAAGCDELEPGVAYQFAGRSQEFTCSDGGTEVGLIHSFDAELQQSVVRYLDDEEPTSSD